MPNNELRMPAVNSLWHHRNGCGPYVVAALANLGDDDTDRSKYPVTVVYKHVTGNKWFTRRLSFWYSAMEPYNAKR